MKIKPKKLKLLAGITAISFCTTLVATSAYKASAIPGLNKIRSLFTTNNSTRNTTSNTTTSRITPKTKSTGCFDGLKRALGFKSSSPDTSQIDGQPRNHKKRANINKDDIKVITTKYTDMNKLTTLDFKQEPPKETPKKNGLLYRVFKIKNNDPKRGNINRLFKYYGPNTPTTNNTNNEEGAVGGWGVSLTNTGMPIYQNIDADGNPIGNKPNGTFPVTDLHSSPDPVVNKKNTGDVEYVQFSFNQTNIKNKPVHDNGEKVEYAKIKSTNDKNSKTPGKVEYAQLNFNKNNNNKQVHDNGNKVEYAKIKPKKSEPVYQNIDANGQPIGDKPYVTFPVTDKHVSPDPGRDKKPSNKSKQLTPKNTTSADNYYNKLGAKPRNYANGNKKEGPAVAPKPVLTKKGSGDGIVPGNVNNMIQRFERLSKKN